jgi:hypothetical protein
MPRGKSAKKKLAKLRLAFIKTPPDSTRNSFALTHTKVSSTEELRVPSLEGKLTDNGVVRVALVSLPRANNVRFKTHLASRLPQTDGSFLAMIRNLVTYSRKDAEELLIAFKHSIETAVEKYSANIVCVNELGLPLKIRKGRSRPSYNAIDFCRRLAMQNDCLILAGSAHDQRTYLNTAYLFYPNCERQGACYHKQVSASRLPGLGERISVSPNRTSINTTVFGLRVGFLTCLDVADYSAVAPLVKLERQLDLLLIPTYTTEYETLKRVARLVSEAISGYVCLTNFYREGEQSSHVLRFGEEKFVTAVEDLRNPDPIYQLTIYDIDSIKLHSDKPDRAEQLDKQVRWLFDLPAPQLLPMPVQRKPLPR